MGTVGRRIKQKLIERDGNGVIPNTCFFYDGAFLYFHATDYLLERGIDYEDPYEIVAAMRGSYFHGCSGFFKIEKGSNDRDSSVIAMINFQYDTESDKYVLKVVGSHDPYSAQPYKLTSPIQWPDGQRSYADIKPNYKDCPYLAEIVEDMPQGELIGQGANFGIAVIALLVTPLLCKRLWKSRPAPLTNKELISIEDVLVLVAMVVDCLQLTALGPDLSTLSYFFAFVCAGISVNVDKLMEVIHGGYWIIVDVTFGVVGLWVLICVLKLKELDKKLCCFFAYWTQLLMPALGHLQFLPIIAILSSIFICYKGISNNLTDSFLNRDCYEFCWRGKHLGYAIGSAVALLLYIPVAMSPGIYGKTCSLMCM